ncbi:MAG: hypothetical protein ACRENU_04370 [Gemmatimonadaceae bacterium]
MNRFRVGLLIGALACSVASLPAQQRPDTSRAAPDTVGPHPEIKPPISPGRAFAYSLILPGYSQSILGRHRAGAVQLAFEAVAISMISISAADVREAQRFLTDSIPVSYVDGNGQPAVQMQPTPFTASLVRSRRSRLEDWIAVLLANHLFSAADGYVAALLWDLPAEMSVGAAPGSAWLSLRLRW